LSQTGSTIYGTIYGSSSCSGSGGSFRLTVRNAFPHSAWTFSVLLPIPTDRTLGQFRCCAWVDWWRILSCYKYCGNSRVVVLEPEQISLALMNLRIFNKLHQLLASLFFRTWEQAIPFCYKERTAVLLRILSPGGTGTPNSAAPRKGIINIFPTSCTITVGPAAAWWYYRGSREVVPNLQYSSS
jgi:hypothetical protein